MTLGTLKIMSSPGEGVLPSTGFGNDNGWFPENWIEISFLIPDGIPFVLNISTRKP